MSLKARILRLSEQGLGTTAIAKRLKCDPLYVSEVRCKAKNPELYRAMNNASAERVRRANGSVPVAEWLSARKAESDAQMRRIQPLLQKGLSWRKAAKKLGISHNVIAGLAYRARQREQASA